MTTALVTGATGFVGKRIAEHLIAKGTKVKALTRRNALPVSISKADLVQGDLTSMTPEEALEAVDGVDVVVHCAAELSDVSGMRLLHVAGTETLAKAAAGRVSTWVQLSSAGALGQHVEGVVDEESRGEPVGEYEKTKAEADETVWRILEGTGSRCVILQPTIIFHADMPNDSLRRAVLAIRTLPVPLLPDARAIANYVHLDDVVSAVMCAVQAQAVGRFLIADSAPLVHFFEAALAGAGQPKKVRALPGLAGLCLGRLARTSVLERWTRPLSALTSRAIYSSARAEQDLGWAPARGWRSGIDECGAAWAQGNVRT